MKTLFYFSSDWCVPCQSLGPTMDKISQLIPVEKINIDYEADRTHAAKVMSIPTVILAENGQEVKRFVGNRTYEQVLEFIK